MEIDSPTSRKRFQTTTTRDSSVKKLFRSNLRFPGDSLAIQEEASRKGSACTNKLSFASSMASFGSSLLSSQAQIAPESLTWKQADLIMVERLLLADISEALFLLKTKPDEDLQLKLDKERTLLMYCTARKDPSLLKALIARQPQLLSRQDSDGRTALHYAVLFSRIENVAYLADFSHILNISDCQKQSAAHLAAILKRVDLLLLLAAKRCKLTEADIYGFSVFDYIHDDRIKQDLLKRTTNGKQESGISNRCTTEVTDSTHFEGEASHIRRCVNLKKSILNRIGIARKKGPWQALRKTEEVKEVLQPAILLQSGQQEYDEKAVSQNWIIEDVLGVGSFGTVYLGRKDGTDELIAIKEYSKRQIRAPELTKRIFEEKKAAIELNSPFIVKTYEFFQTSKKLYMTLEYFPKRDLGRLLHFRNTLNENEIKILAAELVLAIEVIHSKGFIHRDLKPDNVFISDSGHIVVGDFGLCKKLKSKGELSSTFCGTLCYLPPEILKKQGYSRNVDWYLLGELLFECAFGAPPFFDPCSSRMRALISNCDPKFPSSHQFTPTFINLLKSLLDKDPSQRLGSSFGARQLKRHPFFLGVDWKGVATRQVPLFNPSSIETFRPKGEGRLLRVSKDTKLSDQFTLSGWSD